MADQIQRNHSSSSIHRNRSSSSIHGDDHHTARHHKPKQFHVGGARHHSRVPSYGRNLNKLGAATSAAGKVAGSPKDKPPRSAKRPTFELGDEESEGEDSYKELAGVGNGGQGSTATAVRPAGLVKSSSTRSLDRESRARKSTNRVRSNSRSKSGDRRARKDRINSSDALTTMAAVSNPAPAPQLQPAAPIKQLTPQHTSFPAHATSATLATNIDFKPSGSNAPLTPAHSLPSSQEQPLTSRFTMQSPSTPAPKTPPEQQPAELQRTESTPSVASSGPTRTSRTQKKLWLQRAESQQEIAQPVPANIPSHYRPASSASLASHHQPGSEWFLFQNRAQREFDRVAREYMNVRRFENPLVEGLERHQKGRRHRIPNGKNNRGRDGGSNGLGLSQSLKEASSTALSPGKGKKQGARDDSGIVTQERRSEDGGSYSRGKSEVEVEGIIKRLWRGQMLPSNE